MNYIYKIFIIISTIGIIALLGFIIFIFSLSQIKFMGDRDAESVNASFRYLHSILYTAKGEDSLKTYELTILDNDTLEYYITTKITASMSKYMLPYLKSKDTLLIKNYDSLHELPHGKLLICNDKILYRIHENSAYDTNNVLTIVSRR